MSVWCKYNRLDFNVTKCKTPRVYRASVPPMYSYNVDGTSLGVVGEIKDLGVIVDRQKSWEKQVHGVVNNAKRTLGLIKRTFGTKSPQNVKC